MATHPCPCGYRGHPRVPCRCPPGYVERYLRRISGPLLDRIDLKVEVLPPTLDELSPNGSNSAQAAGESGCELAARVERARARARECQGERPNSQLEARALDRVAPLDGRSRALALRAP